MSAGRWTSQALRAVAILIAVVALIDPAFRSMRSAKPDVAVLAIDSARDAVLATRVAHAIDKQFTVARSIIPGASAVIYVGDRAPGGERTGATVFFAVRHDSASPAVAIEDVRVPRIAALQSRVPVRVSVHATGSRGQHVELSLRSGDLLADEITVNAASNDARIDTTLFFAPSSVGAAVLRVVARSGGGGADSADAVVDVQSAKRAVLVFDPRPSWMSTFVRRALQSDVRFTVASRVVTSKAISAATGDAPARLSDPASLAPYDAVIVGAPEAMSSEDVAGLETYMRRRGGSVLLLLDARQPAAYDRLTGVAQWKVEASKTVLSLRSGELPTIRTSEIAAPAELPASTTAIASDSAHRAVVWRASVGAGTLVVSGALDAWRYREEDESFDRFWRGIVADAAARALPPLSLDAAGTLIVAPGDRVTVDGTVRDAALDGIPRGSAHARLRMAMRPATAGNGNARTLRLVPAADIGTVSAAFRAPTAPGIYRLSLTDGINVADAPLVVARAARSAPAASASLETWARVHAARVIDASDLERLSPVLTDTVKPPSRLEVWHPMRSGWWIVPFALALSGEWWLRRRRSLR